MKVVLDCNIWISFLLGFQVPFVRSVLNNPRIEVYVCPELLREIRTVATRDKIKEHLKSNDLDDLLNLITAFCEHTYISQTAQSPIRDSKDLYLLSLADSIDAAYIVSGDKDLTDLQHHNTTQILTIAQFKQLI